MTIDHCCLLEDYRVPYYTIRTYYTGKSMFARVYPGVSTSGYVKPLYQTPEYNTNDKAKADAEAWTDQEGTQ